MEQNISLFYGLSFLTVIIAFAFALYLYLWVKKMKVQNSRIEEISKLIKAGADTFMAREYKVLGKFAAVVAVIILLILPQPIWEGDIISNLSMAIAYIGGTVLSAIAGKIGILYFFTETVRTCSIVHSGVRIIRQKKFATAAPCRLQTI